MEVLFARLSSSSVRTSAIRSVQLFSCTQGRVLFLLLRGARAVEESHRGVASMRRCNRIRHCLAADWIDTFSKDLDLTNRDLPERLDGTHGAGRSGSEVRVRKERKGDLSWTYRGFERGELVDEPHASGQDGGGARSERSTCRGGPDAPTRHLCVRRASFRVPKERLPPRLLVLATGTSPRPQLKEEPSPSIPTGEKKLPRGGSLVGEIRASERERAWKATMATKARRLSARCARTCASGVARKKRGKVVEHVVLFKAKEEAGKDVLKKMMDGLWSLQYRIPNVLYIDVGEAMDEEKDSKGYTHALFVRLRDQEALEAYAKHPQHLDVVENLVKPNVVGILALDYMGAVSDDIGPTFHKGRDWEEGYNHIRLFKFADEHRTLADAFLSKYEDLTFLASELPLQITTGENFSPERSQGYTHGSMARFTNEEELRAFREHSTTTSVLKDIADVLDGEIQVTFHVTRAEGTRNG